MKILNEQNEEIQQEDVDLSLGYLQPDKLFVEHHPEVQAKPAVWHYKVSAFYFTDGTSMKILSEEDPHIVDVDARNGKFDFQEQPEDEIKGRELKGIDLEQVEDEPRVEHQAEWVALPDIKALAFDHNLIIREAMTFIRQYVDANPSALFDLLPRKFTALQLRRLYELVYGKPMDVRNFHKKIALMGYVTPLDEKEQGVAHRAARYYRFDKKIYNKLRR